MATPMIVTYRISSNGGGGGGGVSFFPHQQTEHLKIFGHFCSRATQVTRSNDIHVTDVVAIEPTAANHICVWIWSCLFCFQEGWTIDANYKYSELQI